MSFLHEGWRNPLLLESQEGLLEPRAIEVGVKQQLVGLHKLLQAAAAAAAANPQAAAGKEEDAPHT